MEPTKSYNIPIFVILLTMLGAVSAFLFVMPPAVHAAGGCVSAVCLSTGAQLDNIDDEQAALLNALLGNLLAADVELTAAEWNSMAAADITLGDLLTAIQADLALGDAAQALSADLTMAQLLDASANVALSQSNSNLANALNALKSDVGAVAGTIQLDALLQLQADLASFLM